MCFFSISRLVYNGGFLREGTSSTRLAVKERSKMNQLFDTTISKIVWYACRILLGQSLHRLSTCLIPVYSVRSSVEWFPVSAMVSHLCVKQLGQIQLTLTVIKRWKGGYKKRYNSLQIRHMCSSFIFNTHKMISISFYILRVK